MHKYLVIAAAVAGTLLAGCSANGNAQPPLSNQPVPLASIGVLQFAVGTANLGQNAAIGINTVATFRQTNGLTAALVNSPTITGPAGFVVPACGTGCVDAGTNHMSYSPQNIDPNVANPVTVFGQTNGVFSYGIAPDNSTAAGGVAFGLNNQPFFPSTAASLKYVGGPPAYAFFRDGTFPSAFIGYTQGFTAFNIAPVAGTYTLSDAVTSGNAGTATFTATGTISNLVPLPNLAGPTFVKDGLGGGAGVVTVPVDARVVETMVYFNNLSQGTWFAVGPIRGTGAQAYTLPDFLGPCTPPAGTGCQNNAATRAPTMATGASYKFYAVTYDYPMFEAGPPGNTSQTPAINGGAATSNQADLTSSPSSATLVY